MKINWPFRRREKAPPDPYTRQTVWYWRFMALAIIVPVAIPIPYLEHAVPGCMLLAVAVVSWQVSRILSRRNNRSWTRVIVGGMATIAATFVIALIVSGIYVARHHQAVPAATSWHVQLVGAAYLIGMHLLITRFVDRRWPIQKETAHSIPL